MARAMPISRGRRCVPACARNRADPRLRQTNVAEAAAKRRSHASAISSPPPKRQPVHHRDGRHRQRLERIRRRVDGTVVRDPLLRVHAGPFLQIRPGAKRPARAAHQHHARVRPTAAASLPAARPPSRRPSAFIRSGRLMRYLPHARSKCFDDDGHCAGLPHRGRKRRRGSFGWAIASSRRARS